MKALHLTTYLAFAASAWATNVGDSYAQVLAERGKPANQLAAGSVVVLNYADASIRLKDRVVVEIRGAQAGQFSVVHAEPPRSVTRTVVAADSPRGWTTDYKAALANASAGQRNVFLLFTGSDWCVWCKRLHGEILSTEEFKEYAAQKLELVELDFPRKTAQAAEVRSQNQQLQQQYGIRGYPTVIVLNPQGEIVGRLGYQKGGPGPFIDRLKSL